MESVHELPPAVLTCLPAAAVPAVPALSQELPWQAFRWLLRHTIADLQVHPSE